MPIAALRAYADALPRHKSEYQMLLTEAASFPHLDEKARRAKVSAWAELERGALSTPQGGASFAPLRDRVTMQVGVLPWETDGEGGGHHNGES